MKTSTFPGLQKVHFPTGVSRRQTPLDISKSMDYRSGGISKLDYARFAAASLAYLCNRQRDRVGLVTFDGQVREQIPPSAKHYDAVLRALGRLTPGGDGELEVPLARVAQGQQRRGVMVLLSDLYQPPEQVLRAVSELRLRGNDLIVLHLLDPAELEFTFDASADFEDLDDDKRA